MAEERKQSGAKFRLAEEAANILRRLDENPEDIDALADKHAFEARGPEEKRIYAIASRAFSATSKGIKA